MTFEQLFDNRGRMRISDGMRYYKKTDEQNNMPRFVVEMNELVDCDCLNRAAQKALERHRVFRMTVVSDSAEFFLTTNDQEPLVHHEDGQRHVVGTEANHGYLTWIGYRDHQIMVEFFHGVSDGMGVIAFVKTLLYHYCCEKYGAFDAPKGVLTSAIPEDPLEYADSLLFIPEEPAVPGVRYEYEKAFQLPDEQMKSPISCRYYELTLDAPAFEDCMRRNRSSRSALFAWMMNRTIARVNGQAAEPIVAALAVNARAAYGAQSTEQCCVATIPLWYDAELAALSDAEQCEKTREMIVEGTKPHNIIAGAQRTKQFNERLSERYPTLLEKQAFACMVNKQGGIKYTYGLSYIGEVTYGAGIDEHVQASYAVLCSNTIPVILEIAKCRDHYHISYCTHLENDPYVWKLREAFEEVGISCNCVQKEDFIETLACF